MSVNNDIEETGPAMSPLRPGDDPAVIEVAGQWTLMWLKFTRNKVAAFAGLVILFFYFI